jgi:hypothetical protein
MCWSSCTNERKSANNKDIQDGIRRKKRNRMVCQDVKIVEERNTKYTATRQESKLIVYHSATGDDDEVTF